MKEGAAIVGAFGTLIGLLINLNIPSGEEVMATGLMSLNLTGISAGNASQTIESLVATLVVAAVVGAVGVVIGALLQTLIGMMSDGFGSF